VDSFHGKFWPRDDSFPSDHAVAWAVASVLTHEYPGPQTEFWPTVPPRFPSPGSAGKTLSFGCSRWEPPLDGICLARGPDELSLHKILRYNSSLPKPSSHIVVQESTVLDLVFLLVTALVFGAAVLYLRACERLK
jgi:hypothetical protein